MTDEDPTAALARLEAQIAMLSEAKAKLVRMVELEAELRRLKAEVAVPGDSPLTIGRESSTFEVRMEAESSGAERSAAQFDEGVRDHKFVAMLLRRKVTVADVAAELEKKLKRKIPARTVQSWYQPADDEKYRPVPEDAALALKEPPYSVPFSAWTRIRKRKVN